MGFPGGANDNLPANNGDPRDSGSIPESGRSPGGRNGNPLQHSCLENPMDRGAWRAIVHGVAEIGIRLKRLHVEIPSSTRFPGSRARHLEENILADLCP